MGKQRVQSKKSRKSNPRNAIQKEKNVQSRLKKKKQQQNQSNPLEDNAIQKEKNVQSRLKKKKKQQQNQSNPLEENAIQKAKNVQSRLKKKKKQQQNQSNPLEDNAIQKAKNVQSRLKKKQQQQQSQSNPPEDNDPILLESDDDGAEEEEEKLAPEDLQPLLEEYSKDQLITFLTDAAADDPSLLSHIRSLADYDISHRKVFICGFGRDVTTEALIEAFRPYGPVADCNIVVDKVSGRSKGYGFVIFSTRSGAVKALKDPEKKIGNRMAFCEQSSHDNVATKDLAQRRVYVGNIHTQINPDKLKAFLDTFGEIESSTYGLDPLTGNLRGYAIFIYKTLDGASKVLHEPYKKFEGHELYFKLATDHSQKGKLPVTPVAPQSLPIINQQPALNAMAASQNVAYNTSFAQNPLFNNAAFNSNSFSALNPAALAALNPTANLVTPQGLGYGGQGLGGVGVGLGGSNAFGTYRTQESTGLSYGGYQLGQSSSLAPATGFYRSFPQ